MNHPEIEYNFQDSKAANVLWHACSMGDKDLVNLLLEFKLPKPK